MYDRPISSGSYKCVFGSQLFHVQLKNQFWVNRCYPEVILQITAYWDRDGAWPERCVRGKAFNNLLFVSALLRMFWMKMSLASLKKLTTVQRVMMIKTPNQLRTRVIMRPLIKKMDSQTQTQQGYSFPEPSLQPVIRRILVFVVIHLLTLTY